MNDISPQVQARYQAVLSILAGVLGQENYTTQIMGPQDDMPLPTLLVALGMDEESRERSLGITIMPLGDNSLAATELVQFYSRMPFPVPAARDTELRAATAAVNAAMALGHFAVLGEELFYRYVLAVPNNTTIDSATLLELVALLEFHQEHFADYLEGVIDDEISLKTLPELIAMG